MMRTIVLAFAIGLALTSGAMAQQKQHLSFKVPAANTTYTQQHAIDVGDIPGHQVRVYELHRTFPANGPTINGMKITEQWTRATSDYIDNSGSGATYGVYVLENGDKFFTHASLVAQSPGSGKNDAVTSGTITGGTGSLAKLHGVLMTTNHSQPQAGINENETTIDYWFE